MGFQLNSKSDYDYADVTKTDITGDIYPRRAKDNDGRLCLRAEDVTFLLEALYERIRIFDGTSSDHSKWNGLQNPLKSDGTSKPKILDLSWKDQYPYTDIRALCKAYAEPYQSGGDRKGYVAYVDSDLSLSKGKFSTDVIESGSGSLSFSEIVGTGGWPGDSDGSGNVGEMAGAADLVKKMYHNTVSSISVVSSQSGNDGFPLQSKRLRNCMEDVRRLGRIFVPCTVSNGTTCTFSASGTPECVPANDEDTVCDNCGWPTSREISIGVMTYAECLTRSNVFYPFLCWCMCPLWHGTALWSHDCDSPAYPEFDRFENFNSNTKTPTFYFSWASRDQCCPTVAGINGAYSSNARVSVDASYVSQLRQVKEFEWLVVFYRCWHSAGPEYAIDYEYKFIVKAYKVSGQRPNLPEEAVSAETATKLLSDAGFSDPNPSESIHSDQIGVDLFAVYAVVKPDFKSDLSEFKGSF